MSDEFSESTAWTLGRALRRARERRGLAVRELATAAGLSPGFLSRVELDQANPTWRTIRDLAAALRAEPQLRLIPEEAAVAKTAALVADKSPLGRLLAQPVNAFTPLSCFVQYKVAFVVTGSVAALLQGLPTPVQDLEIVVLDSDDALLALQQLLLDQLLLFQELEVDELREIVQRSWAIGECAVGIVVAAELPASQPISLDDFEVRVALPQLLLEDPEVAATIRIAPMRSSDL
jgi:transcriptional regulator with XRE-family HTH domain